MTTVIFCSGRLSAMDLVEVNPDLGDELQKKRTIRTALEIIKHSFGERRQGTYPPGYSLPVPENNSP